MNARVSDSTLISHRQEIIRYCFSNQSLISISPIDLDCRLLQVARILTSDWLKLHRSHAINNIFVTCCKTIVCLGPVKRPTCADFAAKNRTSLYFSYFLFAKNFHNLQQSDLLQDRFDSWEVKREKSRFNSNCSDIAKQIARFC